jgi:hypothetical protein
MKANAKKIDAVTALPSIERYKYFVKVAADTQEVWGLYDRGWAMASTESGEPAFPLWPSREFAEQCLAGAWKGFVPRSISLADLLNTLLPKLKVDRVLPAIFPSPQSKGVTPSLDDLVSALNSEMQRY